MMRTLLAAGALLALPALALTGCGDSADQCSEDVPCGFGEACIEGTCQTKSCSTSRDCPMETTCNGGSCDPGCAADDDCYPGDACDPETNTCVSAGCRNTTLDCSFGEFCNTVTGECYPASGYYCKECFDDDDCGGNGNLCLGWGANGNFCGVTCEDEGDCPSGYTCVDVGSNGEAETKQCITYCWYYITDDAKGPGAPVDAADAAGMPAMMPGIEPTLDPTCETGDTW